MGSSRMPRLTVPLFIRSFCLPLISLSLAVFTESIHYSQALASETSLRNTVGLFS